MSDHLEKIVGHPCLHAEAVHEQLGGAGSLGGVGEDAALDETDELWREGLVLRVVCWRLAHQLQEAKTAVPDVQLGGRLHGLALLLLLLRRPRPPREGAAVLAAQLRERDAPDAPQLHLPGPSDVDVGGADGPVHQRLVLQVGQRPQHRHNQRRRLRLRASAVHHWPAGLHLHQQIRQLSHSTKFCYLPCETWKKLEEKKTRKKTPLRSGS